MKLLWIAACLLALSSPVIAQQPHRSDYRITDFGAIGDGTTLNTKAIQRTVDSCSHQGGGRIIVPAGNFVTGSIRLFSNMEVCLEAGATLTGSPDNKDYLHQKDFG